MEEQLTKKNIVARKTLGNKIRREKIKVLAHRLRGAMHILGLVDKKESKRCRFAMTKKLINRYQAIRAEGCGYRKAFYCTVKWTAEDNGINDSEVVKYAVKAALMIRL